jgi:hypothetical protein
MVNQSGAHVGVRLPWIGNLEYARLGAAEGTLFSMDCFIN